MKIARWIALLAAVVLALPFVMAFYWPRQRSSDLRPVVIECDCGRIQAGSRVEKTVKIGNPTNKPLTVQRMVSSCGCLKKTISTERIDPGTEAELSLAYEAGSEPGKFHQSVAIIFAETKVPASVNLFGSVVGWYSKVSGAFVFGDVVAGATSIEQLVEVELEENCPEQEIQIQQVDSQLEVRSTRSADSGKRLSFRAVYRAPSDGQYGRRSGDVVFQWKGREERRLRFPWSVMIISQSDLIPRIANFGVLSSDSPKRAEVLWRQRGSKRTLRANDLVGAHQFGDALQMSFLDSDNSDIRIEMTLSRHLLAKEGTFEGTAAIATQDGNIVIQVPLLAWIEQQRTIP